jgi:hypothetical protein
MEISYVINADSAIRAQSIARSRAMADGWSSVLGSTRRAFDMWTYEVRLTVAGRW